VRIIHSGLSGRKNRGKIFLIQEMVLLLGYLMISLVPTTKKNERE